jgi:hypothetical protein
VKFLFESPLQRLGINGFSCETFKQSKLFKKKKIKKNSVYLNFEEIACFYIYRKEKYDQLAIFVDVCEENLEFDN